MSDKDLDKIFADKLRRQQYEFNPGNWQAMEQMLDARRASLPFYWRSTLAILLMATIFLSLNFYLEQQATKHGQSITTPALVEPVNASPRPEKLPDRSQIADNPAATSAASGADTQNKADLRNTGNEVTAVPAAKSGLAPSSGKATTTSGELSTSSDLALTSTAGRSTPLTMVKLPWKSWSVAGSSPALGIQAKLESLPFRRPAGEWWVAAGPAINLGQSGGNMGSAWFAGIYYERSLTAAWRISGGLSFYSLHRPDMNYACDSVFYNFGQEILRTEISDMRLHYLSLPLELSYRLKPRHTLSAGLYVSRLMNVRREIKQTHFSYKSEARESSNVVNGDYAYFRDWDAGLSFAYHFRYSQRMQIGLQSQMGLTDLSADKYYSNWNKTHRNLSLRLSLKYKLL